MIFVLFFFVLFVALYDLRPVFFVLFVALYVLRPIFFVLFVALQCDAMNLLLFLGIILFQMLSYIEKNRSSYL